ECARQPADHHPVGPGGAPVPRLASSAAGAALSLAGCRPPPIAGRATGRFAVPPDRGERTLADSGPAVQAQRPQRWRCACSRRDAVGTSRSYYETALTPWRRRIVKRVLDRKRRHRIVFSVVGRATRLDQIDLEAEHL